MIRCSISVILRLIDEYHWSIFDNWIFKVSTWCRFGIFRRQLIIQLWGILRVMHSFMDLCNYLIFRKIVWFYLRRIFDKRIILFWAYPLWYLRYPSQEWVKIQRLNGILSSWFVLIWFIVFSIHYGPILAISSWIFGWIGRSWSSNHLNCLYLPEGDEDWSLVKYLHTLSYDLLLLDRNFWWPLLVSYLCMEYFSLLLDLFSSGLQNHK